MLEYVCHRTMNLKHTLILFLAFLSGVLLGACGGDAQAPDVLPPAVKPTVSSGSPSVAKTASQPAPTKRPAVPQVIPTREATPSATPKPAPTRAAVRSTATRSPAPTVPTVINPTGVPTPSATPVPEQTAPPTIVPPSPTIEPTSTALPSPVPQTTPTPEPTNSPVPTAEMPTATITPTNTPMPDPTATPRPNVFDQYGFTVALDEDASFASSNLTVSGMTGDTADGKQGLITFHYNGADIAIFWLPATGDPPSTLLATTYQLLKDSQPSNTFTPISDGDVSVDGDPGKFVGFIARDPSGDNAGGGLIAAWDCQGLGLALALIATGPDATTLQIRFDRLVTGFSCS